RQKLKRFVTPIGESSRRTLLRADERSEWVTALGIFLRDSMNARSRQKQLPAKAGPSPRKRDGHNDGPAHSWKASLRCLDVQRLWTSYSSLIYVSWSPKKLAVV